MMQKDVSICRTWLFEMKFLLVGCCIHGPLKARIKETMIEKNRKDMKNDKVVLKERTKGNSRWSSKQIVAGGDGWFVLKYGTLFEFQFIQTLSTMERLSDKSS